MEGSIANRAKNAKAVTQERVRLVPVLKRNVEKQINAISASLNVFIEPNLGNQ